MNITHQRQRVAVLIDQKRLESPAEKMSHPLEPCIEIARIAESQILQASGQRLFTGLQGQMQVIGHQTEGMHAVAEALDALGHEFMEIAPISRGKENILARVAAQDDVIETAGDMKARFAGHVCSVTRRGTLCN